MRTTIEAHSDDAGQTRVYVKSDRVDGELVFNFTDEGLIIDLLDGDGISLKTFANMYDELEDLLK